MLGSQVEDLLPADELVVHIRSGDNILAIMDWTTRDATSNSFVENSIVGAPIQPGCDYYLDAALRGNNGGPFAKVHVMVDLKCAGGSAIDMHQYHKAHGDILADPRSCESTNPCLVALMDALPEDVLVFH